MDIKVPTDEMVKFATEYAIWAVTFGLNYMDARSKNFSTEPPIDIFIREYYLKDWKKEKPSLHHLY